MDTFRPIYHFTPPQQWMNDPNGLVYFNGEYHLFYQHYPQGSVPGPMHWGHAVSGDLVNWTHLPIGLYPDDYGVIYSGSAVVDWQDTTGFFGGEPGMVAIFTHHARDQRTGAVQESQSLAYSKDNGRTWVKYEGNPVLCSERFVDFRDPKVFWHADTARWVMIVAAGQSVCLYHSPNLKDWTFSSEFGQGTGWHDGVWECPDLFALPVDGDTDQMKWVMLVSVGGGNSGTRTQYFIGAFDGSTFVNDNPPEQILWLDYGMDTYVGVTWSDIPEEDGRRIHLAWMSNGYYATVAPTKGWRSAMTIPRTLSLATSGEQIILVQQPIVEMRQIRTPKLVLNDMPISELKRHATDLRLTASEIIVVFDPADTGSFSMQVRVCDSEQTRIGYDEARREIYVDRTSSGIVDFHERFAGIHAVPLTHASGVIKLQVFVDICSVEVFINDGEAVITDLIFPKADADGIAFDAEHAHAVIQRLEVYGIG